MRNAYLIAVLFFVSSCAGWSRGCASWRAGALGSDWIVAQQRAVDGKAYNCWTLRGVSIANEEKSDGIYWQTSNGHLLHIAGQYARVQVSGGAFKEAGALIGVDADKCTAGAYPAE